MLTITLAAMFVNLLDGFPAARTIQTQNAAGAVIFWDATAYVERFAAQDLPPRTALQALEFEAIKIFVSDAQTLAATYPHVRMTVSYAVSGPIAKRYATPTFGGFQQILTLDAKLSPGMKIDPGWEQSAESGVAPPGVTMTVSKAALQAEQ